MPFGVPRWPLIVRRGRSWRGSGRTGYVERRATLNSEAATFGRTAQKAYITRGDPLCSPASEVQVIQNAGGLPPSRRSSFIRPDYLQDKFSLTPPLSSQYGTIMKIIGTDNLARESVADTLVAENIKNEELGKIRVEALNAKLCTSDQALTYYLLVADDRRLSRDMEDLV